jgi:hypothetical protein
MRYATLAPWVVLGIASACSQAHDQELPPELPDAPDAGDDLPTIGPVASCFVDIGSETGEEPDYDQFGPTVGSHCAGTNHQAITGVERVVFLGDSVTVGSPPTHSSNFFRSLVADALASRFGLEPPSATWKAYDSFSGTSLVRQSGAFWSCAEWGARIDDLMEDGTQIADCFPEELRDQRTLVIMTVGGNDLASIAKDGIEGETYADIQAKTEGITAKLVDVMHHLKDPIEFPGGNYVVFANPPEFTDGTGDTLVCPAASLAGFDGSWENPAELVALVAYMVEEYMRVAVETESDLVFFLESFCGHGFNHDDPDGACYRGDDAELWFDFTCIHPNPVGHEALANLFLSVVDE